MQRHDLLLLTKEEQERALAFADGRQQERFYEKRRQFEEKGFHLNIPVIVRRQEHEAEGKWEVGFSFPWFEEGRRCRLAATVAAKEIIKVISPFDRTFDQTAYSHMPMDERWRRCLKELEELAEKYRLTLGIYGSAGLELMTGLPYLHEKSDIDIIIMAASYESMEAFYRQLSDKALKYHIKIDLEIRMDGIGDIKAQELFSEQKSVLVRGLYCLELKDRKDLTDKE